MDLKQSHQLCYPTATFGLATAYFLGDDIYQDLEKTRELFINSNKNGVWWSARGLSHIYANEIYECYDLQQAEKWEAKFKNGDLNAHDPPMKPFHTMEM